MSTGEYVGYIYIGSLGKKYLKEDGFWSSDIKEARRFLTASEAVIAARRDPDVVSFSERIPLEMLGTTNEN